MDWKTLEDRFLSRLENGDWDAEWCFDPDRPCRQEWRLIGRRDVEELSDLTEELAHAGRRLRRKIEHGCLIPKKLIDGDVLMAEVWLRALRHLRINVDHRWETQSWRRDEGRIIGVVHASAQLCIRLRAMEGSAPRSQHNKKWLSRVRDGTKKKPVSEDTVAAGTA